MDDEKLIIGGKHFKSRLFVGTGKYDSMEAMAASIAAAETEMVTVAIRRVNLNDPEKNLLNHLVTLFFFFFLF